MKRAVDRPAQLQQQAGAVAILLFPAQQIGTGVQHVVVEAVDEVGIEIAVQRHLAAGRVPRLAERHVVLGGDSYHMLPAPGV